MELSLEIYSLIVAYLGNRADICSLTRVSKSFQAAAERALYNTLLMSEPIQTMALCSLLAQQPRIAALVVALTITTDEGSLDESESGASTPLTVYWEQVHRALCRTSRLRYLNIYIEAGGAPHLAWIFHDCPFQLRAFHCDLIWDSDLIAFLLTQAELSHLHISDFRSDTPDSANLSSSVIPGEFALRQLSVLECTFIDVVALLAPGRPLTHVKTCFSRTDLVEKRAEAALLVSSLQLSTTPVRSLNIPDSAYTTHFSLDLLSRIVDTLLPLGLQYLGPFVLPVNGRERLRLYGLFHRLPHLRCVELEVSAWDPPPVSIEALRSLARELRLYASSVLVVIFLADLEEVVLRRTMGGSWIMDDDANPDTLWLDYATGV